MPFYIFGFLADKQLIQCPVSVDHMYTSKTSQGQYRSNFYNKLKHYSQIVKDIEDSSGRWRSTKELTICPRL